VLGTQIAGVTISAENNRPAGPDKAIVFDSANPTGDDFDLGAPNEDFGGPGIGAGGGAGQPGENSEALGKLIIIAENDVDSNNDGLVDDPDDEGEGGTLFFDFDAPVEVISVRVIDIDAGETGGFIRSFDSSGTALGTINIPSLGDNSEQVVPVGQTGVKRLEIELVSSGDVATLTYCPPPPTPTPTSTATPTDTSTPTPTSTATPTDTSTATPTDTSTATPTDTSTATPTDTSTATPTDTSTATPTDTSTPTPTSTATPTDTSTATPTDTSTATPTDTFTPTPTPTETATPEPADICGQVFLDTDADGQRDLDEPGIEGILVTATAPDGTVLGMTTTDQDGRYVLTFTTGQEVRIEFTNVPPGLFPGHSEGLIRFVTAPNCNVDLPLIRPPFFCADNAPTLATACYAFGDQQAAGSAPAIVSFPYTAGAHGSLDPNDHAQPPHPVEATAAQVGTTWGLAWQHASDSLFAAAFMKRHAGFGPGGPGAIYRIDRNGENVGLFLDLNALFGSPVAGLDPHASDDYFHDPASWDPVGKLALGGMDLSEDQETLYVLNLAGRSVIGIPIGIPPAAPISSSQVAIYPVPLDQEDCPDPVTDLRPFALTQREGRIYVGAVCSAESTLRAEDLRAYVYGLDPGSGMYDLLLDASLNYPRRCADAAWTPDCSGKPAAWNPWRAQPTFILSVKVHPQPWLTDLVFDGDDLVLGLRDRFGDQRGVRAGSTDPADPNLYSAISAGDLLRACSDGKGGFRLESNGSCGGVTTAGAGSGQGPGGGEFYFEEDYPKYGDPAFIPRHDEIASGGLAQVPFLPDVLSTAFDPVPVFDDGTIGTGGVIWQDNASGARSRSYEVYAQTQIGPTFGKANGLGDLEALCEVLPIELGNRVWHDLDEDGLQDAGEPGVPGVTVELYEGLERVSDVRTDQQGIYRFERANVPFGVRPGTEYSIHVVLAGGPLSDAALSPSDQGANDLIDSDGVLFGGNSVAQVLTGAPGENDYSVDFGFTGKIVPTPPIPLGPSRGASILQLVLSGALLVTLVCFAPGLARRRRARNQR
jgi:hypothetical protein